MTDREAILQGILDDRASNTPRMIYADFLDDCGSGDVDAATVEFIRASCREGANKETAHAWLMENWRRLVPTFMAKWCRAQFFETDYAMHTRKMQACAMVWYSVSGDLRNCVTWLYFDRGFVSRIWSPSYHVETKCPASVAKDQPLLNLIALPPTCQPQLVRDRRFYQGEMFPTKAEVPA
jgi:uncharacterized protein (TIGR02996 family)